MQMTHKLTQPLKQIPGILMKFPVELLLAITFYVLALIGIDHQQDYPNLYFESTLYAFFPLFVLTYSLNRPGWKWKIPYILSYFLWIPVLIYHEAPVTEIIAVYVVVYLLAVLLLLIGKEKTDNAGFAANVVHVVKYFALSCIIGLALVAIIFAIALSVPALFEGEDAFFSFAGRVSLFVGILLVPMLSCILVGGRKPAEIFIEKRPFTWFYRWFPLIATPIVVLLWVGIIQRVADYGLTEGRVYLLAAVALVAVIDVMMFFARTRDFRKMAIALGAVAVLLTFVPGISAFSLGILSQRQRLQSVLPLVTDDRGFFQTPDYDAIARDPELERAWRKAASAYEYLYSQMGVQEFHEAYDIRAYGSIAFSEDELYQAQTKKELGF